MGVLLGLVAAVAYGTSDFVAGLASRRSAAGPVTATVQATGVVTAAVAVAVFAGRGPAGGALGWGALSGVGSGFGTLTLYQGLAVGRMSVVATVSAVLSAVVPALVGVALGNHLSIPAQVGIGIGVAAIALVSWQPEGGRRGGRRGGPRSGLVYGVLAGLGFALLFVALDRAGTASGAWPLLPGQAVSFVVVLPFALRFRTAPADRSALPLAVGAGVLSGAANLTFLAATGRGQLAVVAVLTSLYPAFTVVLARVVLDERWSRLQAAGLVVAGAAIALVSAG